MTQHALYVQLEAKPGKEQEVVNFLSSARSMVRDEPETTAWFAIRMGAEDVRHIRRLRRRARPRRPSPGQAREANRVDGAATVRQDTGNAAR